MQGADSKREERCGEGARTRPVTMLFIWMKCICRLLLPSVMGTYTLLYSAILALKSESACRPLPPALAGRA